MYFDNKFPLYLPLIWPTGSHISHLLLIQFEALVLRDNLRRNRLPYTHTHPVSWVLPVAVQVNISRRETHTHTLTHPQTFTHFAVDLITLKWQTELLCFLSNYRERERGRESKHSRAFLYTASTFYIITYTCQVLLGCCLISLTTIALYALQEQRISDPSSLNNILNKLKHRIDKWDTLKQRVNTIQKNVLTLFLSLCYLTFA